MCMTLSQVSISSPLIPTTHLIRCQLRAHRHTSQETGANCQENLVCCLSEYKYISTDRYKKYATKGLELCLQRIYVYLSYFSCPHTQHLSIDTVFSFFFNLLRHDLEGRKTYLRISASDRSVCEIHCVRNVHQCGPQAPRPLGQILILPRDATIDHLRNYLRFCLIINIDRSRFVSFAITYQCNPFSACHGPMGMESGLGLCVHVSVPLPRCEGRRTDRGKRKKKRTKKNKLYAREVF